ncbi:MAG: nucleoside monophosphate kinase [Patescibacteria group bacterium]
MLHTAIFIGRSGCGKGTQAELFQEYIKKHDSKNHKILYVETGARFREFIKSTGYSSKLSNEIYMKDERQPDFLACLMWANMIVEELGPDMHLVFDGAPRSHSEAVLLSTALQFYKREKPAVVYLKVSHKWSEEKLLARGRQDDKTLSKIDKRLDWFEMDTWPAVEYFKTNSLYDFLEINGEQTVEEVHRDIIKAYET